MLSQAIMVDGILKGAALKGFQVTLTRNKKLLLLVEK